MTDSIFGKIAAAMQDGNTQQLAEIAMTLAAEVGKLQAIAEADATRKKGQRERTRRHRNGGSRDVTLQSVTERDVTGPPSPPSPSLLPPEPPNNSSPTPSPSGARTIALRPSGPAPDVLAVLEHYRARHPRRKPGPKELTLIGKALSWGYSAADLREAIDGNADDPWHAEKGKHDLGYVLRDRGHIDDARAKHAAQSPVELRDGWFADVAS